MPGVVELSAVDLEGPRSGGTIMLQDALARHLPRLRYLSVIAAAGSLGQAAKRLKMSASALSEAVRVLEVTVGVPIIVRSCRGVRLTDVGMQLKAFAAEMDGALAALEKQLGGQTGKGAARRVKLWTKEPFAAAFWPHYVKAVRQMEAASAAAADGAQPMALELKISRSNRDIETALKQDEEAVALVAEPDYSSEIELYEVVRDQWALHGVAGGAPERGKKVRAFWFRRAVAGPNLNLGDWFDEHRLAGEDLELVDVDSLPVAAELALAGEGLALLPSEYVRLSGALRALQRVATPQGLVPTLPDLRLCLAVPLAATGSGALARLLLRAFRGVHGVHASKERPEFATRSVEKAAVSRAREPGSRSGATGVPVILATC
jgi:DNA-binding transcriptional LysR family regulator